MEVRHGYKQTEVGVVPKDWHVRPLKDISPAQSVGLVVNPSTYFDERGSVPMLLGSNISANRIDWESAQRITEASNKLVPASTLAAGDLVTVRVGEPGTTAVVPPELDGCNCASVMIVRRHHTFDSHWLCYLMNSKIGLEQVKHVQYGTAQKQFNIGDAVNFLFPVPLLAEQEAIVEALSGADALVESLEQLIAKKRELKQGAMHELLTGKKRLPGFSVPWLVKQFAEVVQPRKERIDPRRSGRQEFCIELEHVQQGTGCLVGHTATSESSSLKSVFRKGDVLFGKLRAYLRKYWLANRDGVCSTEIWALAAKESLLVPQFLFQLVRTDRFIDVASSAYGTHMPRSDWNVVRNYEVRLPPVPEQSVIALILSDMDDEIATLDADLAKARQIKQGMMQQLLTGRIRLVGPVRATEGAAC
jgi:type I restriction enzyme, S subunit